MRQQICNLTAKQLDGINRIEQIMQDSDIGMADVRAYYKEHAPKPVRVRLTTEQRLGLKQVLKLIKLYDVTSDELREIFESLENQAIKSADQGERVQASFEDAVGVHETAAVMSATELKAQEPEQVAESAPAVVEPETAVAAEVSAIEQLAPEASRKDEGGSDEAPKDDPAATEKGLMDMLAAWKAGRKGGQMSWNMPSLVSQAGSTVAQANKENALEFRGVKKFGLRPGDPGYVKYRHPYTLRTWNGKGEMPQWLKDSLLNDGMAQKHFIPVENFPLEEAMAGLPAGVPFEELAAKFNLKQKPLVS